MRVAMIFIVIGYCVADALIPVDYPSKAPSGINFGRAMCTGAVCSVVGTIGYSLGLLFFRQPPEQT
jgi:hypothetical protein